MSINLNRTEIGEGAYINFAETKKHKTNYMSVYFFSELTKKSATYCKLISQILPRGTEKYPTARLFNRALDACYGTEIDVYSLKHGETQGLCVTVTALADRFALESGSSIMEEAAELAAEMIFSPFIKDGGFDEGILAGEKVNAKDAISARINNKAEYAKHKLISHMCENEKYSIDALGYEDMIDEATGKDLYEFYKEFIKSARIEICFFGDSDPNKLSDKWREILSSQERAVKPLDETVFINDVPEIRTLKEEMDITQSHLLMGYRTDCAPDSDEIHTLSLYNAILGGSLTSKLFMNVREKKSLCYTVSSALLSSKGLMRIYAGVDKDKCSFAIAETDHQIKQIERGNITDEELRDAKITLISSLRGLEDSPGSMAGWFLQHILAGRADRTPDSVAAIIDSLTKEDVVRISRRVSFDTLYILEGTAKSNGDADEENEE